MARKRLARVALIHAGGTISTVGRDRFDLAEYADTGKDLGHLELLERLPELTSIAEIELVPFRRLYSNALAAEDWLDLASVIHDQVEAGDSEAVVITHGTNTIEETAYFLHLTLKTDKPVVVVGAMRPASAASPDGDLNLANAMRVAADPASRGRGVLVVLNEAIFSARDVTKGSTHRVHAFQGRDLGPLGYADNDRVVYYHSPDRLHTLHSVFDVHDLKSLPRVDVVTSYVGADGTMIDAAVAAGASGIVSAGFGAGRPTPEEDEALDRACHRGIVICQSSRTGSGRVVPTRSLKRRGMVAADNLSPGKAGVLLALALTVTNSSTEVQRIFDTH